MKESVDGFFYIYNFYNLTAHQDCYIKSLCSSSVALCSEKILSCTDKACKENIINHTQLCMLHEIHEIRQRLCPPFTSSDHTLRATITNPRTEENLINDRFTDVNNSFLIWERQYSFEILLACLFRRFHSTSGSVVE